MDTGTGTTVSQTQTHYTDMTDIYLDQSELKDTISCNHRDNRNHV